MTLVMGNVLRL